MNGLVKIEGSVSVSDVLDELARMGVISDGAADLFRKVDGHRTVEVNFEVDSDDLVDHASPDVLIGELRDRGILTDPDPHILAEGVRYAVAGQALLAEAMFARALPDIDMVPIYAACRQ